jgi:HK97 gp10 family phage protein
MAKSPAGRHVLELHGVGELIRSLQALTPAMENKVLRKAMRAGAKPILAQAKANAPVSDASSNQGLKALSNNTANFGALFGATEKQIAKAQKRAVKQAVTTPRKTKQRYPGQLRDSLKIRAMKRKKGRIGYLVQSRGGDFKGDTYYAAFVEYGTSKMAARGFIRAAFDTQKQTATDIIEREVTAGINQVAAELRSK